MKRDSTRRFVLGLLVAASPLRAATVAAIRDGDWVLNPKAAQQESFRTNRPLLVYFTDTRACPTCQLLEADIFSRLQFKVWCADKVILLRVDRASRAELDAAVRRQHEVLRTRYLRYLDGDPTRVPVILLLNPIGSVIGDKAFPVEGHATPDAFTKALQEFLDKPDGQAGDAPPDAEE